MRFMMLMIPLGYETAPPDVQLDPERVKAMMKYNEALKDAGVLIALDGLHPPSMGARVSFATGKPVVTDGPFTEAKEVLGGYWMIDVKSREEAIAWARKCPASENEIIEIRQVQEMADFSEEVQRGGQRLRRTAEGKCAQGAVSSSLFLSPLFNLVSGRGAVWAMRSIVRQRCAAPRPGRGPGERRRDLPIHR